MATTCHGIRLSGDSIEEMDGETVACSISRANVLAYEIGYGFASERPIMTALFGAALLVGGLFFVPHLWDWTRNGGTAADIEFLALLLLPVGTATVYKAIRRRFVLRLGMTDGSSRKLAFARSATRREVVVFGSKVDARLTLHDVRSNSGVP